MKQEYYAIYKDLTIAAHRAYKRGVQTGSGGNLSACIQGENIMVVKSSGGSFSDCTDMGCGWIAMNYEGEVLDGEEGKPTREWKLHSILLRYLKGCNAVVHTHSPYTIVWGHYNNSLPMVTWHSDLKIGQSIPVLDIPAAIVPEDESYKILKMFQDNTKLPAVVLKGHGIVAVGKSAVEAEHTTELIEETAKIAVLQKLLKENGGK